MADFDTFMQHFAAKASTEGDRRLLSIFEANRDTIREHFEGSLPANNSWAKYEGPAIEFFGPTFHKGFRQMDILPTGAEDSEVWCLLAGGGASAFWDAVQSTLAASGEASK